MTKEGIINKVKKLLALSNGTCYEEEAQSAMLKAQEILLKEGLTMSQVDMASDNDGPVVITKTVAEKTSIAPEWKFDIGGPICKNFRVTLIKQRSYSQRGRSVNHLLLVGLEEDVLVCEVVLEFAFKSFEKTFKIFADDYYYTSGRPRSTRMTVALKNDYTRGYANGLRTKFREQVESKALVLVQNGLVKQYMKDEMNLGRPGEKYRHLSAGSQEAFGQGVRDGKSLDHSNVRSNQRMFT